MHYDARCIDDLQAMLQQAGDWVDLGDADEQKPPRKARWRPGAQSPSNPVQGWYGLKKGLCGRF